MNTIFIPQNPSSPRVSNCSLSGTPGSSGTGLKLIKSSGLWLLGTTAIAFILSTNKLRETNQLPPESKVTVIPTSCTIWQNGSCGKRRVVMNCHAILPSNAVKIYRSKKIRKGSISKIHDMAAKLKLQAPSCGPVSKESHI